MMGLNSPDFALDVKKSKKIGRKIAANQGYLEKLLLRSEQCRHIYGPFTRPSGAGPGATQAR